MCLGAMRSGSMSDVPAQVELFTAYGHYQPAGAVRVTWLHIAARQGHVGLGTGSPNEGSTNFLQQVRTTSNI